MPGTFLETADLLYYSTCLRNFPEIIVITTAVSASLFRMLTIILCVR